jgi:hypothetical protein
MVLRDIHQYYGEFLQLIPIVLLIWFAVRRKTPLQRIAPILLDINVLIGIVLYIASGSRVSVWHPIFMIAALGVAHGIARSKKRSTVIGGWIVVLALVVVGIRIAAGDFLTTPLLPAL